MRAVSSDTDKFSEKIFTKNSKLEICKIRLVCYTTSYDAFQNLTSSFWLKATKSLKLYVHTAFIFYHFYLKNIFPDFEFYTGSGINPLVRQTKKRLEFFCKSDFNGRLFYLFPKM
jgi:hypothetical protein